MVLINFLTMAKSEISLVSLVFDTFVQNWSDTPVRLWSYAEMTKESGFDFTLLLLLPPFSQFLIFLDLCTFILVLKTVEFFVLFFP